MMDFKKILPPICFFVFALSLGQIQQKPEDFIPEGYTLFDKYACDVNHDKVDDAILMVKKIDPNNIVENRFGEMVDRNRRGIIVLFRSNDGYQLADQNLNCFSSENEDGGVYFAPELWFECFKGNLKIHYAHGRYGYWSYLFRYQDGKFKLIGYDRSNDRGPVISSQTSINFLTEKKLVRDNINEANDEGGEEIFKETWSNIIVGDLLKLSKIKDFDLLYFD